MGDPAELRDVPAIALCATCGDASCPGHDLEASGERPIARARRALAWEDGETPPLRALWRTSMAATADLELWVRASTAPEAAVGPAFSFAIAVELLAVASICVPLAAALALAAWQLTTSWSLVGAVIELCARVAAAFVPLMIAIHVAWQWAIARGGDRRGRPAARTATLRAGLYACGWDLATGPLGVLAPLLRGRWSEARARLRGNSRLFRDATRKWLDAVHGVGEEAVRPVTRGAFVPMAVLVSLALALVGWAFSSTFR
jgi:hypothetical protein